MRAAVAVVVAAASLAACVPTGTDRLELRPAKVELAVDHDLALTVDAREGGKALLPADLVLESEQPEIARAAPGGRVEGITVGSTRVIARWRGRASNRVRVRIVPEYRQEDGRSWGSDGWVEVGAYLGEVHQGARLGGQAADAGKQLIWLHAWVQNRRRPAYQPSLETFALIDSRGQRHPQSDGVGRRELPRLLEGGALGVFEYGFGWLLFEIPAATTPAALEYRDGTIATLRISLVTLRP